MRPVPAGAQGLSLLFASLDANVEDVASAKDDVTIVCRRRVAPVLCGSIKYYVHVAVCVNHSASIFYIILQADADFCIQLLHEKVEWFSRRLQVDHWNTAQVSSLR